MDKALKNSRIPNYLGTPLLICFARTEDRKRGVAIYANPKLKNKIKVSSISGSAECIFETILLKIEFKKNVSPSDGHLQTDKQQP